MNNFFNAVIGAVISVMFGIMSAVFILHNIFPVPPKTIVSFVMVIGCILVYAAHYVWFQCVVRIVWAKQIVVFWIIKMVGVVIILALAGWGLIIGALLYSQMLLV